MVSLYAVMPHTNVERVLEVAMTVDVPFDNLVCCLDTPGYHNPQQKSPTKSRINYAV